MIKKYFFLIMIIFILTGCSSQDNMVCTLKKGDMTNVLKMEFKEGTLVKTSNEYSIVLDGATKEDMEKTMEDTKAQYIADGFTNVEAKINNGKVLIVNADVDLKNFIHLYKYNDIKKYYKNMGYECK